MSIELAAAKSADFAGRLVHDEGRLVLELGGTGDYAALDSIDMLLATLHEEARRLAIAQVTVDLTTLEFMNSASFKAFVGWIVELQELPANQQYKIELRSNPQMHWQKRSMHSLRCFAVELITVVEV